MSYAANGHQENSSLRVEAPNAASGFMLVKALGSSYRLDGSDVEGWIVSGTTNGNLPHALAEIQRWLRDELIDQVTVHLGDHTHSMTRD
jgi:hypothetical protein